ncbi:hypothetical protein POM88_038983 [Heracleum sosnowskyi]|uniref:Uncharacterized protein n=1 Tax=Heracleum sosnowskyi TaxID=360622 RepID=A0AAD8M8I6_9APIA|nr:hypothetical protein POM88_038983 [Heracleum sosnowskyi]
MNPNHIDSEDLRVPSFSFYLDSAEESFVPKLTKGIPLSSSPVVSPEASPCLNNLERNDNAKPEVSIFGAHISNTIEICMRYCGSFFASEGTCLEKKAECINGSADYGVHGMVQSQPGPQNVEQFSFPVLNSRIENLKAKKHDNAEIVLQGDWQNSVEIFGSGMTDEIDIAVNLEKRFSRLTTEAIPDTGSRSIIPASSGSSSWCGDTASDNSSDLFDIESTKPDALRKAQTFAGASDKSLTVSADEKKNPNCVGDTSSTNRTTKLKVSSWIKGGGRWLLGCTSINAVRVVENTSRTSESTKPDALSKAQTFDDASDKSLTVSDDEKRNPNWVGDTSSTNRTTKLKISSWIKSGGRWLLGCRVSMQLELQRIQARLVRQKKMASSIHLPEMDLSHCSLNKCLHLPNTIKSATELHP